MLVLEGTMSWECVAIATSARHVWVHVWVYVCDVNYLLIRSQTVTGILGNICYTLAVYDTHVNLHTHTHTRIHTHVHTHMYTHTRTHTHVHTHTYTHTRTHTHTH